MEEIDLNSAVEAETVFDRLRAYSKSRPWYRKAYRRLVNRFGYKHLRYRFKRAVVWKWQRANRGWSDFDTWGFDHYLANVMAGGIRRLREDAHGHPVGICSCENKDTWECSENCDGMERWLEILDKMIEGFEAYTAAELGSYEAEQEAAAKCKESLLLVAEHFGSLWD